MNGNALHLCVSRLRDLFIIDIEIAYGHAMLSDMLPKLIDGIGGSHRNTCAYANLVAQGASVPIPTGGPPIFNK